MRKSTTRLRLDKSEALWARASALLPCGTQTMSKGPSSYVEGVFPKYLERGQGSRVFDVDGNEYIDYILSLGPISLGHGYPAVLEAVERQLRQGTTFSLMHPLEVELAELLVEIIPCAEMVRYSKNGSDVTNAAVKLARVCTGRPKIAFCGYHGSHDWYVAASTRPQGVPSALAGLALRFEFNRIDTLDTIFQEHPGQIAAVILEPVTREVPRDGFLEQVRERAHQQGALLIFDEVVTGFRWALGGAQQHFGVTPDLACFGKAIANGFPLAVLAGRRTYMREMENLFFSMTFAGEALSLAAALATLQEYRRLDVIGHLAAQTARLREGFNRLAELHCPSASADGEGPLCQLQFEGGSLPAALFMQEMVKRGVLITTAPRLCFSHSAGDVDDTLQAAAEALQLVQEAQLSGHPDRFLEGTPPRPVFPGGPR